VFTFGAQPPIQTWRQFKDFKHLGIIVNAPWYAMILHIVISTYHTLKSSGTPTEDSPTYYIDLMSEVEIEEKAASRLVYLTVL